MRAFLLKYLIAVPVRISGHGEPKEGRRRLPVSTGFLATVILFKPEKPSRELGAIIVPLYSMWKVTGLVLMLLTVTSSLQWQNLASQIRHS